MAHIFSQVSSHSSDMYSSSQPERGYIKYCVMPTSLNPFKAFFIVCASGLPTTAPMGISGFSSSGGVCESAVRLIAQNVRDRRIGLDKFIKYFFQRARMLSIYNEIIKKLYFYMIAAIAKKMPHIKR